MRRNSFQKFVDFLTFPIRAFILFGGDRFHLSSLASERFDYVAREVTGYCLDVGCGRHNRFINQFLGGNGKGIDVYAYEGLSESQVVEDLSSFPFDQNEFDCVTFIANINHIPKSKRDSELREAFRVLKPGGKAIVTMGNPLAEIFVHKLVWFYDNTFGTSFDMDSERGMHEEEEHYLVDSEIISRLERAGFRRIVKRYFWTQWGLNHLFVGWKATE
jgi:SAM-dependent methyltransferase